VGGLEQAVGGHGRAPALNLVQDEREVAADDRGEGAGAEQVHEVALKDARYVRASGEVGEAGAVVLGERFLKAGHGSATSCQQHAKLRA
jgi:hypothetical protein